MKKCVAMVLTVLMLVSLCACSSEPTSKGTNEELREILDGIRAIPVATMGVSMTVTARAVELLDWCEATSMSEDELADFVKYYHAMWTDENRVMLEEQVSLVVGYVELLSRDDLRKDALEAAGFSAKLTWSDEAFALAACIDDKLP